MHAVKNACVKGSRVKSALATMEAEFLKLHHSYDKIDLIIAPSEFMKSKLEEGGFAGKVVALQNFLTDSQMEMARKVANTHKFEDAVDGKRPYFLFFGRLSKEKGILTLVRAFLKATGLTAPYDSTESEGAVRRTAESSEVANDKTFLPSNWDLHIVGDGPGRSEIERLVADAGSEVASRIQLLGYKSGEDLQREVGNARFSVLSSEWRENMPYSGLESLAAKTPVIGARIGGIPELVVEGETGFAFESGNVSDLTNALIKASHAGGNDYQIMQQACTKYVNERCEQSQYVRQLEDSYRRIARGE